MQNPRITRVAARLAVAALALATPAVLAAPATAIPGSTSTVFVNEFHYENDGTDVGEFVEVAGPAGTDLTGWSIVLYNGSGGGTYDTDALSGTIPGQQGAYGTVAVSYPTNGLQNGSPDGIALINPVGAVVQFLSYEGSFMATNGPASGSTSTDIGVSQTSSEPVGSSLHLTGTGDSYADFSWSKTTASTQGSVNAGQTFGSVADTAPSIVSVSPANGATATANQPITVTFSEPVAVAADAWSLLCSVSGGVSLTVSGGPSAYTLTPTEPLADGDSCILSVTAAGVTDVDENDPPNEMLADFTSTFTVADLCVVSTTSIPTIQGAGATAPLAGQSVTTRGVVVGDHEGAAPNLRGFYLQDPVGDSDPATSDAIFVFNGGNQDLVSVGDVVTVRGNVGENQGQTQVSTSQAGIAVCGAGASVAPTEVTLPLLPAVDGVDHLERFEGMLVTMPQTLYVTEHFQLGRFGQVVVSSGDRLRQPTNVVSPGPEANALQAVNNLNRLIIDDNLQSQNPDPIVFARGGQPLSAENTLRGGDTITGATGVMTFTWGGNAASPNAYRLRPVGALAGSYDFVAANQRPESPEDVGGDVKVASINLLNYFNTFDGLPDTVDNCVLGVGGPAADCRGADTQAEFDRQWPKTVAAIVKIDSDVIGVNEIENDGYGPDSAIAHLVGRLNAATAPGTYAFIDADAGTGQTNALGTDAIKVGMIYRPAAVTPIGRTAALNTASFVTGGDSAARNRPALAQAFSVNETGGGFVATANHLKSKGSACTAPDAGDGQGNCNEVRVNAATELAQWLASDPTETGEQDILITGDLNSYAKEDPIKALEAAGYTNLVEAYLGTDAYSYVFDGQWGYLDHALGSADLVGADQVTGVAEYHINADEPSVLDYNTDFKTPNLITSLYAPDEFRVSDHDPVIVGLRPNSPATVGADFGVGFLQCGADNASLVVAIEDRDAADTHTVTVDWGDGTEPDMVGTGEDSVTLTHTYAAAGSYTATVTVLDSHGHVTTTTAKATVAYDTSGITPPFRNGAVEANDGSAVPVKVEFVDCDGSEPRDLHPTITVTMGDVDVLTGSVAYAGGQWKYVLDTKKLDGPGTYTVTITVPETGQTVEATLTVVGKKKKK